MICLVTNSSLNHAGVGNMLFWVDLSRANLTSANLYETDFIGANTDGRTACRLGAAYPSSMEGQESP